MQRIETPAIPSDDRIDHWRKEFGRTTGLRSDLAVQSATTFETHSVLYSMGSLAVGQVWGVRQALSPRERRDERADTCLVVVPRVSKGRILHDERVFRLSVDQAYLLDDRSAWSLVEDQRFRHLILSVPRSAVPRLAIDGTREPFLRPLTATATLIELMKSLVETHLDIDRLPDAVRGTLAETLCELLDAALDPLETQVQRQDHAAVRKAHQIRRIRQYVLEHLNDPLLSAESVASAIGVSSRHVHRLFSNEAQALGPLIRAERLDRCRAELTASGSLRSISTVAYAWGFNDAAHFSRVFRQRFGMTPREARCEVGTPMHGPFSHRPASAEVE